MESSVGSNEISFTPLRTTFAKLSLNSLFQNSPKQYSSSLLLFDEESQDSGFGSPGSPLVSIESITTDTEVSIPVVSHRGPRKALFSSKRSRDDQEDVEDGYTHKRSKSIEEENFPITFSDSSESLVYEQKTESHLCNDDVVKSAVEKLEQEEDLIGDGSRGHLLPTTDGKKADLKYVSPSTVSQLLEGKYNDLISSFEIIDCRYPYEFNGGHIEGAKNIYTEKEIEELVTSCTPSFRDRHIVILHCEFSSERGPKMLRHLRSMDRKANCSVYPSLYFPEIYILSGGYKAFYESHVEQCQPMKYTPMLHKAHSDDLRHFRSRSKSWTAGEGTTKPRRNRIESLCFD